jgi:hypothetical protein
MRVQTRVQTRVQMRVERIATTKLTTRRRSLLRASHGSKGHPGGLELA